MVGDGPPIGSGNGRENIDRFEWEQFLGGMRGFFEGRRLKDEKDNAKADSRFAPFTPEDAVNVVATASAFALAAQAPTTDFPKLLADQKMSVRPFVEHYLEDCVESGTLTKEGDTYIVTEDMGAALFWDFNIDI